jgi:hypothetical protein
VQPEVVTLLVLISYVSTANAYNLLQHGDVGQGHSPQFRPIPALAAGDNIVDSGQRETLVIQMTVQHGGLIRFYKL